MLEDLMTGKQVNKKDHNGMLSFYANLQSIFALAKETGREKDFEAESVTDTILQKKLPHLTAKWCKKVIKVQMEKEKELGFADFLVFLRGEYAMAEKLARATKRIQGAQFQKQPNGPKIHSTGEKTRGQGSGQAGDKCRACEGSHAIIACPAFKSMSAADKRRICYSVGLCFKCLQQGHQIKDCSEVVKCSTCSATHHTLTHALFASTIPKTPAAPQGGAQSQA